jgi:hypothetical protein
MPRLLFTQSAQSDLLEAWLFIAEDNPAAADGVLAAIEDEAKALLAQPSMGRARPSWLKACTVGQLLRDTCCITWPYLKGLRCCECCTMLGTFNRCRFEVGMRGRDAPPTQVLPVGQVRSCGCVFAGGPPRPDAWVCTADGSSGWGRPSDGVPGSQCLPLHLATVCGLRWPRSILD